jgi:hypothetical protein
VLNMTRAFGTALGVAITSLVYEISGSGVNGYRAAMSTLAVLAALAAVISLGDSRSDEPRTGFTRRRHPVSRWNAAWH